MFGALGALNAGAWFWALLAFHDHPALLGVALVIYGLGLRHAVDADHIAAIDNVTRKLMQARQQPVCVGLFFAIGHSSIVILATALVVGLTRVFDGLQGLRTLGGLAGTAISTFFLMAVAVMNITIFISIYRTYRNLRTGGVYEEADIDVLLASRGLLARLIRPLFRLVTRSWHMLLLGLLFGLGFDTATEVAVFGVASIQAAKGIPLWSIMVFPTLFASGMSLIDSADGVMMLGAYNWSFVKPMRKLYYNMTITLLSVLLAVLIGAVEGFDLIARGLGLKGHFWNAVDALTGNMNGLGLLMVLVFLVSWLVAYVVYTAKGLDNFEVRQPSPGTEARRAEHVPSRALQIRGGTGLGSDLEAR